MKWLSKIWVLCLCFILLNPISVYATAVESAGTDTVDNAQEANSQSGTQTSDDDDSSDDDTDDTESTKENDTDPENETASVNSKVMLCDNWKIPTVTYGQKVNIVLPLVNMDQYNITDVIITPVISTETSSFPFEIEKTGYAVELTELLGTNYNSDPLERRQEVTYTFTARDDISTGYYAINFEAIFKNANGEQETATISTYVNAIGKKGNSKDANATSVPRVIVTGFETTPEDVRAGEDFTLTLHIKNTSTNTEISNMKCDLEAAADGADENAVTQAFLPKEGSSTVFMDSIGKDETKDLSIEMNAKASLTQKPYVLNVKMEYEDDSYNQYTSEANVSIPVLQEARFEISEPEVMPASIQVGSESNVMFSIYNTGKTVMYNTSIKFEADSITGGDTYVGKIQTGETGNVDAMITAQAATKDEGIVKILITYEDEAGNPSTIEKTMNLTVTEENTEFPDDIGVDLEEESQEEGSSPILIIVIILILIGAAIGGVVFYKIRKKKQAEELESQLLDDMEEDDVFDIGEEASVDNTNNAIEEESTNSENNETSDEKSHNIKAPQEEGDDDEIS